jgi:hypothetical protein
MVTDADEYRRNIETYRKYRKEHAKQRNEYNKQWKQRHPEYGKTEKNREYQKAYRKAHSEENKEYMKKWIDRHPEYNAQRRQWRIEHPERTRIWQKNTKHSNESREHRLLEQAKWREQNAERVKMYSYIHGHEKDFPLANGCEFCEDKELLVRHHPDYEYPEIYVTCCSMCHQWIHRVPVFYPIVPLQL